ncbi:Leukocyte-associated immunoglobulin-like receptor 1 [Pteropus alecto]|nr:Leukocyte-associated immunoglobulin-like receptor 1 [Pteropus alecto]
MGLPTTGHWMSLTFIATLTTTQARLKNSVAGSGKTALPMAANVGGPPISNGEKQSPQERFSPAIDIIQRTPDVATVGKLPEGDRKLHALSPAAEDPQEVTYAQLDHQVLTLRAAGAQSLQSTEPTADASTYAALARR